MSDEACRSWGCSRAPPTHSQQAPSMHLAVSLLCTTRPPAMGRTSGLGALCPVPPCSLPHGTVWLCPHGAWQMSWQHWLGFCAQTRLKPHFITPIALSTARLEGCWTGSYTLRRPLPTASGSKSVAWNILLIAAPWGTSVPGHHNSLSVSGARHHQPHSKQLPQWVWLAKVG